MLAYTSPPITRRRRRSALPVLLALAVPLALAACDSADKAFAPTGEPPSEPAAQPAAADYVLAATTGQRIAFASYRNGNQPDIYKMDPQGNSLAPVSLGSGDEDAVPAWSHDNTRLVMQRRRPYGTGYTTDIYMKNADGSNGHWVRPAAFPFLLRDPSWSPDGSRILLTVELNGGGYLAWMSVVTGEVTLVNAAGGGVPGRYPSYNATGQRIVYVASFGKSIDQINADGTGYKGLVAPGSNDVRAPVFSPDGK
jgi:Tol biopolymer transport system component